VPDSVKVPWTRDGQKLKAILSVKQKPWYPDNFGKKLAIEVGDFVQVLSFSKDKSMQLKAKNPRTGGEGNMCWNAFKNVNAREVCGCKKHTCYCNYDNFKKSMAYFKNVWG
jgi:hypothetical protein